MPLTGAQFPHFLAKSAFLDWIFLDVFPSNRNKRMTKRYRWKRDRCRASHLVRLPVFPARSVRPHALPLRPAPALSCSRSLMLPLSHAPALSCSRSLMLPPPHIPHTPSNVPSSQSALPPCLRAAAPVPYDALVSLPPAPSVVSRFRRPVSLSVLSCPQAASTQHLRRAVSLSARSCPALCIEKTAPESGAFRGRSFSYVVQMRIPPTKYVL